MAHKLEAFAKIDDADARDVAEQIELLTGLAHVGVALLVGGPDLAVYLGSSYGSSRLAENVAKAQVKLDWLLRSLRGL